ncbi:hypothetical protein D3C72_1732220 [compost metagenome]
MHHDRSHQRRGLVPFAVDDQNIARLRQRQCCVDHQIVTGAYLDSEGGPGDFHGRAQGPDPAMQRAAASADIGEDRRLEPGSARHDLGGHALKRFDDVGQGHDGLQQYEMDR